MVMARKGAVVSGQSRRPRGVLALWWLERCFLLLAIGLLVAVFWQLSPGWLNSQTVPFLIAQNAPLEVVAVAMTFSMTSANIDLSPGSMLSFAGMVTGLVAESTGSLWYGLVCALGLTVFVGAVTGLLVGWLRINGIIVTLSTYIWAAGLATSVNNANAIPVSGALLRALEQGAAGWTYSVVVVAACVVVGHFLLTSTKFGLYCRAIGGNADFARRGGVPVRRYTLYVFVMMGFAIWLATVLSISQLGAAQSSAGAGLELSAIVAVVIGGTRLTGGEGSVVRSALGALLLAVLSNGLASLGLSDAYYDLWEGLALITVLVVSVMIQHGVSRLEGRALSLSSGRGARRAGLEAA
jgi:ribose/xylose/arabinose/galactoside ABC-type transport system permease subunit